MSLLLLRRPKSNSYGYLSPANPAIHLYQQAVSGDPGVRFQQTNKCVSLSSNAPSAMLQFPQNQTASNFISTPPAMTAKPKTDVTMRRNETFSNKNATYTIIDVKAKSL